MCSSKRPEQKFEDKRLCFRTGFLISGLLSLYILQLIDSTPWKLVGNGRYYQMVMGFLPILPFVVAYMATTFIELLDMIIVKPFKTFKDTTIVIIWFIFWFPFAAIAYFAFDFIAGIW